MTNTEIIYTNGSGHGLLAGILMQHGVNALICGGIGGGAQTALRDAGIELLGGVSGTAGKQLLTKVRSFIVTVLSRRLNIRLVLLQPLRHQPISQTEQVPTCI